MTNVSSVSKEINRANFSCVTTEGNEGNYWFCVLENYIHAILGDLVYIVKSVQLKNHKVINHTSKNQRVNSKSAQ